MQSILEMIKPKKPAKVEREVTMLDDPWDDPVYTDVTIHRKAADKRRAATCKKRRAARAARKINR